MDKKSFLLDLLEQSENMQQADWEKIIPELLSLLNEVDDKIRFSAFYLLLKSEYSSFTGWCDYALQHSNPHVQIYAISFLIERHKQNHGILNLINSPHKDVRLQTLHALNYFHGWPRKKLHSALLTCYQDKDRHIREYATWIAGKNHIKKPKIVSASIKLIHDPQIDSKYPIWALLNAKLDKTQLLLLLDIPETHIHAIYRLMGHKNIAFDQNKLIELLQTSANKEYMLWALNKTEKLSQETIGKIVSIWPSFNDNQKKYALWLVAKKELYSLELASLIVRECFNDIVQLYAVFALLNMAYKRPEIIKKLDTVHIVNLLNHITQKEAFIKLLKDIEAIEILMELAKSPACLQMESLLETLEEIPYQKELWQIVPLLLNLVDTQTPSVASLLNKILVSAIYHKEQEESLVRKKTREIQKTLLAKVHDSKLDISDIEIVQLIKENATLEIKETPTFITGKTKVDLPTLEAPPEPIPQKPKIKECTYEPTLVPIEVELWIRKCQKEQTSDLKNALLGSTKGHKKVDINSSLSLLWQQEELKGFIFQWRQQKSSRGEPIIFAKIIGPIDQKTAHPLEEKLVEFYEQGIKNFVLVLSEVSLVDSTGLGTIINLQYKLDMIGGSLSIASAPPQIRVLFDMLGLNVCLVSHETEEDAFKRIDSMEVRVGMGVALGGASEPQAAGAGEQISPKPALQRDLAPKEEITTEEKICKEVPKIKEVKVAKFEQALSEDAGRPGPIERLVAQSQLLMKSLQATIGLKFIIIANTLDVLIETVTGYINGIYQTWKMQKSILRRLERNDPDKLLQELQKDVNILSIQLARLLSLPGFSLKHVQKMAKVPRDICETTFALKLTLEVRGQLDEMKRDLLLINLEQINLTMQKNIKDFLLSFIPNPFALLTPIKDIFLSLAVIAPNNPFYSRIN